MDALERIKDQVENNKDAKLKILNFDNTDEFNLYINQLEEKILDIY